VSNNTAMQAYLPGTIAEAKDLAHALSGADLLGRAYQQSAPNVLVTIMHGAALGMSPAQALANMHVIEGKPTLSADAMRGICLAAKDVCEYFRCIETTAKIATFETKRAGDPPMPLSYTIEQAADAGLAGRANWKKYPDAMLRARAGSALARLVYPDLLAGVYDPDELRRDEPPRPRGTVTVEQVATAPRGGPTEQEQEATAEMIVGISGISEESDLKTWAGTTRIRIQSLPQSLQAKVRRAYAERLIDLRKVITVEVVEAPPEPPAGDGDPIESPSDAFARLNTALQSCDTQAALAEWKETHAAEADRLPAEYGDSLIEVYKAALKTTLPF